MLWWSRCVRACVCVCIHTRIRPRGLHTALHVTWSHDGAPGCVLLESLPLGRSLLRCSSHQVQSHMPVQRGRAAGAQPDVGYREMRALAGGSAQMPTAVAARRSSGALASGFTRQFPALPTTDVGLGARKPGG